MSLHARSSSYLHRSLMLMLVMKRGSQASQLTAGLNGCRPRPAKLLLCAVRTFPSAPSHTQDIQKHTQKRCPSSDGWVLGSQGVVFACSPTKLQQSASIYCCRAAAVPRPWLLRLRQRLERVHPPCVTASCSPFVVGKSAASSPAQRSPDPSAMNTRCGPCASSHLPLTQVSSLLVTGGACGNNAKGQAIRLHSKNKRPLPAWTAPEKIKATYLLHLQPILGRFPHKQLLLHSSHRNWVVAGTVRCCTNCSDPTKTL